jgi:hypothetical protein
MPSLLNLIVHNSLALDHFALSDCYWIGRHISRSRPLWCRSDGKSAEQVLSWRRCLPKNQSEQCKPNMQIIIAPTFRRHHFICFPAIKIPSSLYQNLPLLLWTPFSKLYEMPGFCLAMIETTFTGGVPAATALGPSRNPLKMVPRRIAVSLVD